MRTSVASVTRRLIAAAFAVCACALGLWIAIRYPLARPWAPIAFVGWTVFAFRFRDAWLLVVPAVLPIVGFASWTGWLLVEELDLLLLGALAAGYARVALDADGSTEAPPFYTRNLWSSLIVAMLTVWTVFAIFRGFTSGPSTGIRDPFVFDLHDYDSPLNSLRVGKSFLWTAALLPLLRRAFERSGTLALLATGLAAGAGAVGLAVTWERAAFTGLLDFSDDYRATGLFWEMHVGGAALDGFIALTLPFAVRMALTPGPAIRRAAGTVVSLLVAYACVATFSRGLYAGVVVSLALLALLIALRGERSKTRTWTSSLLQGIALVLAAAAIYVAFRHGGYRSAAAVLGIWIAALLVDSVAFLLDRGRFFVVLVLGIAMGVPAAALAQMVQKGPYIAFALAWTTCVLAALAVKRRPGAAGIAVACFAATLPLATAVALHWGGRQAFDDSAAIVVATFLVVAVARLLGARLVRGGLGEQVAAMLGVGAVSAIVVVFTAGAYMSNRFATSQEDLAGRIDHWRAGLSLMRSTSEWAFGKGFGRFPREYFFGVPDNAFPGRHKFTADADGNRYVTLTGPNHVLGFGELYRFAQRVRPARQAPFVIALDVRSETEAGLHLEICEQQLLYNASCAIAEVPVHPTHGRFQRLTARAIGDIGESAWYAPRLAFFSVALSTRLNSVDIDNISVVGSSGRELLANGSFDEGGRSWFFVSDRYHLPWHIKSMYLNVLFEEGWAGVALFMLALMVAFHRLLISPARRHVLAPYLASALIGFLVVGLFDSLLDVPRVAFLFYLLLITSLFLRVRETSSDSTKR